MSKGIRDAAQAPAMTQSDRVNLRRAGLDGARYDGVWISNGKDDAYGRSAERLRAEVEVLRRFVADPELGAGDREPGNHAVPVLKAEDFDRAKGSFVELDGLSAAGHIQPGHD